MPISLKVVDGVTRIVIEQKLINFFITHCGDHTMVTSDSDEFPPVRIDENITLELRCAAPFKLVQGDD